MNEIASIEKKIDFAMTGGGHDTRSLAGLCDGKLRQFKIIDSFFETLIIAEVRSNPLSDKSYHE
ncbi:hypothetical protein G6M26_30250 [Agrobacterium tumefaciens]|nr:hypothetical protein [Agrobacterium tumefaciens]NTE22834.1 hypothetical protein [Agrobacterium tumefaciens]